MKIYFIILFCCFSTVGFGQTSKEKELLKLQKLFSRAISKDNFRDTNMTYMFSFKVDFTKGHDKVAHVNKITASDSSASLIYNNYDFLKKIDYKLLMGERNNCSFIFPVAIFLEYPTKYNSGMVSSTDVAKKLVNFLYLSGSGMDNTPDYIYVPGLIMRTSTLVSQ